jgi:hypothetical protein
LGFSSRGEFPYHAGVDPVRMDGRDHEQSSA